MVGSFSPFLYENSGIYGIKEKNVLFPSQIFIPPSFPDVIDFQQKKLRKVQNPRLLLPAYKPGRGLPTMPSYSLFHTIRSLNRSDSLVSNSSWYFLKMARSRWSSPCTHDGPEHLVHWYPQRNRVIAQYLVLSTQNKDQRRFYPASGVRM